MPPNVTMTSGTAGRVRNATNDFVIATVSLWRMSLDTTPHATYNFNAIAGANGRVFPHVYIGLSSGKIYLEGFFNSDSTDSTDGSNAQLLNGLFTNLDLYIDKDAPWGYDLVPAMVTNFTPQVKVENSAATFSCELAVRTFIGPSGVIS